MTQSTPVTVSLRVEKSKAPLRHLKAKEGVNPIPRVVHMGATIQTNTPAAQTTTLADAWATLSAAVPTQIRETTAHLQKALQAAAVTTTHASLAALTGPTGHILGATVAELACDAAETSLLQATDPLRDPSTTNALRDTMRAEIRNSATGITQNEWDPRASLNLKNPTDNRGGLLSEQHHTAPEPSPLSNTTFGPECRRVREHANKKRDTTEKQRGSLLPARLRLL